LAEKQLPIRRRKNNESYGSNFSSFRESSLAFRVVEEGLFFLVSSLEEKLVEQQHEFFCAVVLSNFAMVATLKKHKQNFWSLLTKHKVEQTTSN
jgi:hypothetical protein